jgi:ABC-type Zn uptake system ZnuABC Zn-binding protein ZnuA
MDRNVLLIEADLFISYLTGDELEPAFSKLVSDAEDGKVDLVASSEIYDDVATALRAKEFQVRKPPTL